MIDFIMEGDKSLSNIEEKNSNFEEVENERRKKVCFAS